VYRIKNDEFRAYYKEYIEKDIREFKLECDIADNKNISSVKIAYDLASGGEEYIIGALAAAKLTMNVSSSVKVQEGQEINLTVKLKVYDFNNMPIWVPVPLGRFYVFNVSETILNKKIEAYDDLYKVALEKPFVSNLEYPTQTHLVMSELCEALGVKGFTDIPNDEIQRPEKVFTTVRNNNGKYEEVETDSKQVCLGMSVGEALSNIAAFLGGNFIIDGDNNIKLVKISKTVTKTFNPSKYAEPAYGEAKYNMTRITCTNYPNNVIEVGFGEEASTMSLDNPLMDRTRLLDILYDLTLIDYNQASVRCKGDPTLQLGDLIEVVDVKDNNKTKKIPILRMTFSFTGGCSNTIEAMCKAESVKAINYKGTITSRLDTMENTVAFNGSEIEKINNSLEALNNIKDNVDAMNKLIDEVPTEMSLGRIQQYNNLLNRVIQSDVIFENRYNAVYNNKYL
jgi:hypothetical protein